MVRIKSISQKKICNLIEYGVVIFLILDCRTLWQRLTNTPSWFNIFIWGGLLLSIFGCCIFKQNFNNREVNNTIIASIGLMFYFTLYSVVMPLNTGNYMKLVFAIISMYLYINLCCDNTRNIILKYRDVMFVIAIVSLFFWLFGSTLNIIPCTGKVHTTWDTVYSKWVPSWYYVYYTTQRSLIFGNYIFRNTAIFTEAPMASFHFSLAFLIDSLFDPNKRKSRNVIFIATILTTLSTTGLFVLFLFVLLKIVFNSSNKTYIKIFMALLFPIILCVVISFASTLLSDKMNSISGQARASDFIEGFQYWIKSPLWGYGYKSEIVASVGFSNSIIPILTQCGIYVFVFYLWFFLFSVRNAVKCRNNELMIFMIIFLFLFTITNVAFQHLTLFFVIYLSKIRKSNEINNDNIIEIFEGDSYE